MFAPARPGRGIPANASFVSSKGTRFSSVKGLVGMGLGATLGAAEAAPAQPTAEPVTIARMHIFFSVSAPVHDLSRDETLRPRLATQDLPYSLFSRQSRSSGPEDVRRRPIQGFTVGVGAADDADVVGPRKGASVRWLGSPPIATPRRTPPPTIAATTRHCCRTRSV